MLQLGLRTLSVGLANNLLMNLPEPFKRSTFAAAEAAAAAGAKGDAGEEAVAGDGKAGAAAATTAGTGLVATPAPTRGRGGGGGGAAAAVPAGMAAAPWSVVALAALLQRCARADGCVVCIHTEAQHIAVA